MNLYEEWIKRAKSNLELAQARHIPYVYYEDLCFNLQQSKENEDKLMQKIRYLDKLVDGFSKRHL
jgi:HEPN domain-containing protein